MSLTAQQIYAQQAQKPLELYLYNPKNEPAVGTFNGREYIIPPATECFLKVNRRRNTVDSWHEPGVLPIRGYTYTRAEGVPISRKTALKTSAEVHVETVTPESIVDHLVGPDRVSGPLGSAGVRLLTGNPEHDAIIKADAREAWLRRTYEDALTLRAAHEANVAAAEIGKKPIPSPAPRVRQAYKTIVEYESGGGQAMVKYICPRCGERCKEDQDIRSHAMAYHPTFVESILEKLAVPALTSKAAPEADLPEGVEEVADAPSRSFITADDLPADVPVKRGPGRPRKNT